MNPDLSQVPHIARLFATAVAEMVGEENTEVIDSRNRAQKNPGICHSHDFCDANVFMHDAIFEVTGINVSDELADLSEPLRTLWERSWDFTKRTGFRRLSTVRGRPDDPPEDIRTIIDMGRRAMKIVLPGVDPLEAHPLEVVADYWGRDPRLQIMCYDHGDEEGAPKVLIRYDRQGKVQEVVVGSEKITICAGKSLIRNPTATDDTPWEQDRDANPPCDAGDRLQMPSGQIATVIRLRDRYDNDIEQFREYDRVYGVLARLDGYPGTHKRFKVYNDIEQAWEVNPLTAGTTDPSDFSFVPNYTPSTTDAPET